MHRNLQLVPERAHIKFQGDVLRCARMLPYARKLLRTLILQSSYPSTHDRSKRVVLPGLAQIEVRTIGAERFIKITALGCKDRRGFFITRTTGGIYSARYNDEVVEIIDPITGLPRPDPETASRTIGYVVPSQLQGSQFDLTSAAKFSGLMRLVVGCRHSAGLEAPFSYTWTRTHGIVKLPVSVGDPPTTKTRYWIVEVSIGGVFAAPIKNTRRCCDSWDVTKYQPTDAEIEEDPTLAQHRTLLSLEWAFSVERPNVVQLVSAADMDTAYSLGAPWHPSIGWAFSASGIQAQNVITDTIANPDVPQGVSYRGTRHVLTFSIVGEDISCALTTPEIQQIGTLHIDAHVAAPLSDKTWTIQGHELINGFPALPVVDYAEEMPVYVYFQGELPVITRYRVLIQLYPLPAGGEVPVGVILRLRQAGFESALFSTFVDVSGGTTFYLGRTPISETEDSIIQVNRNSAPRTVLVALGSDREGMINMVQEQLSETQITCTVPTGLFSPLTPISSEDTEDDHEIFARLDVGPVVVLKNNIDLDVFFLGSTSDDYFFHDITTFFLGTTGVSTSVAVSRVFAQHGNLFFDDPKLSPANQYGNAAYVFAPGARISSGVYAPGPRVMLGGFIAPPTPDALIGFVGKA